MEARHALYVGWVLGMALSEGLPLVPVRDADGNYTDRLVLDLPERNVTITFVVPPPAEGWLP